MPMDGVFNGEGRGRPDPHTCTGAVPGGRKQEQQQRRGRVNVSGVHGGGPHAPWRGCGMLLTGVAGLPARLEEEGNLTVVK